MVKVSDKFIQLSKSNGREVWCKIAAGNEVFLDDRIVEFDLDDVIHPNWYTIGSTCSNRFAFSVRYSGELEVHDEVRPYISFDGEEWCPLGVFYVARRYVRGNYASIICYDKMYSLEMEYIPRITAPTDVMELLKDICENYGLELSHDIYRYEVSEIPLGVTVRDMLGYIAGVACGNVKFDREGKLNVRIYSQMNNFIITDQNCMDYSRTMSRAKIEHIIADNGKEIIEEGKGGELITLRVYNPFMTKNYAINFIGVFSMMSFYGADIQMQGLPYLESGDHVFFMDTQKNVYPIAVSEIEFHYDGAFTARLYSKIRTYTDAAEHQDDLSTVLEQLRSSLGNICLKNVNSEDIILSSEETTIADFKFTTRASGTFAQTDINFTLGSVAAVGIRAYVNGELVRETVHKCEHEDDLVHFYFLVQDLPRGNNEIYVTLRATDGEMTIKSGALEATLVCRGAAGGNEKVHDREVIQDKTEALRFPKMLVFYGINDGISITSEGE